MAWSIPGTRLAIFIVTVGSDAVVEAAVAIQRCNGYKQPVYGAVWTGA